MEARQSAVHISQRDVERIAILCDVAKFNGTLLSLRDVIMLTTVDATEEELGRLWASNDVLNSAYLVDSGYIVERNPEMSPDALVSLTQGQNYAESNLQRARRFTPLITGRPSNVKLVSVSGSTSYQSARRDHDVDFFCVTKNDEMWIFMLKTLVLARIDRFAHKDEPSFCFSCVMDERFALAEFEVPKDALFARDALTASPIHGKQYFIELLMRAEWMKNFCPMLYESKVRRCGGGRGAMTAAAYVGKRARPSSSSSSASIIKRVVNAMLYHTLGRYIRLKSNLLNRKFTKENKRFSIFTVKLGEGHCIYESVRYRRLRETYSRFPGGGQELILRCLSPER